MIYQTGLTGARRAPKVASLTRVLPERICRGLRDVLRRACMASPSASVAAPPPALCALRAAKALRRSSAEPPSPHKPPDSVISNWQRGDISILRLQSKGADSKL